MEPEARDSSEGQNYKKPNLRSQIATFHCNCVLEITRGNTTILFGDGNSFVESTVEFNHDREL